MRKAQETVQREQQQVGQQQLQTVVSLGATVLGALMGRRAVSVSTLGRATTAARGVGRSMKEAEDVERAKARLQEAEAELAAIEAELNRAVAEITGAGEVTVPVETSEIKPKRGSVDVRLVALAWQPI
jgi:seryl-tRNA synthetase